MVNRGKAVYNAIMANIILGKTIDITMEEVDQEDCMELETNQVKRSQ